jgi:catechol 2,3-dioxygenase-like lactoylglutathione lyase family enzyme
MADTERSNPSIRWGGVCIDCADAEELAEFYSRLLGWEIGARDAPDTRLGGAGWVALRNPEGGMGLSFQAEDWYQPPVWPEQLGTLDKMIHFEIAVDDLEAAVAHAVAAGATIASHQPEDRDQDQLRVMLDPAGHPFCLFTD